MDRLVVAALTFLAACTTGLGARAVRTERPDYNQQIVSSGDREMLLNLVRLRYNESPLFLELGSVVAQYKYEGTLSLMGQLQANGPSGGTLGSTLDYTETPTVTFTPLAGADFATRLLSPIELDSVMLFEQSGWSAARLFVLTVQRVNDVENAPTASGPTPLQAPDYQAFGDLAVRLERLRLAGLVGLNWERREHERQPPGRNPRFWIHSPADPASPLAADVAAVRRALNLDARREDFTLTAFPFERARNQVGIRCRSLLGVLYFLSQSVEPPAGDVAAGLVTVTRDPNGEPFDWSKITGPVMRIRSQKTPPTNAFVAVEHRGSWFYIADDDQSSKSSFALLNILFSLQAASGQGKAPVLTLPVGGK